MGEFFWIGPASDQIRRLTASQGDQPENHSLKTHGSLPMPDLYLDSYPIFHIIEEHRVFPPRNSKAGELFQGILDFYQELLVKKFVLSSSPTGDFL